MKVRVSYATQADDFYRRAIRHYYGREGLATRGEVQEWCRAYGTSEDDNLMWDLQSAIKEGRVQESQPWKRLEA